MVLGSHVIFGAYGFWLPNDPRVKAFIEKDSGMYDAVNRGYRRASGDILAYLNCDEQYLPGALKTVREFFETHPQVEVLLAGQCHHQPARQILRQAADLVREAGDVVLADVGQHRIVHEDARIELLGLLGELLLLSRRDADRL